jgi:Domain of unknown function (DUF5606)
MDLSGVISISGRPGLYKVIAQGKNSIIVESLIDKKRFPAYATDRISAVDDISIYTHDGDKPLKEILADIYAKQEGKQAPSHKEDISVLIAFILEVLPNYDDERVYPSDIKKLIQWYNMLLNAGYLEPKEVAEEETAELEATKETKAKAAPKTAKGSSAAKKVAPDAAKEAKPKAEPKTAIGNSVAKKPVAGASKAKAAAPKKATKQATTKK